MRVRPLVIRLPLVLPLVLAVGHVACQSDRNRLDDAGLKQYEQRNLADSHRTAGQDSDGLAAKRPRPGDGGDRPMVRLTGLVTNQDSDDAYQTPTLDINEELPDPVAAPGVFQERFEKLSEKLRRDYRRTRDGKVTGIYPNAERNIGEIARARRIELSLADVIRRTLAHNYQIRIEGYGPAISAAQIVQAEAVFDAAFFALINRDDRDTPTAVELAAGQSLVWSYTGGLRQRLITGADATLSYVMVRTDVPGFQFQTLNPSYTSDFVFELRQPLLRNFGVDFNRSQIMIAKNSRESSLEAFRRRVIESLQQVERFYWTLVAARRQVVITGELLAQAERTLEQVTAREGYDAFRTLVANSRSQVEQRKAEFIQIKSNVFDAQDNLINAINDPDLKLIDGIEIHPTDDPMVTPVVRDMVRELEIALDRRPEIRESRLAVQNARIQLGVAKNQAMPALDFVFRRTLNGLGPSVDGSFDQMSTANFVDTFFAIEFAWNFGERAERAGIRLAALQHSQAFAALKATLDLVINECRQRLRSMNTSYEQIGPSYAAVEAAKDNLRSILERAESKSPEQLNTIFNAQIQLANTRQALLQAVLTYNQAIVDVEQAKGTLLEYNNIVLAEQP